MKLTRFFLLVLAASLSAACSTFSPSAQNDPPRSVDADSKAQGDEDSHTEAALKRAAENKDLEKITSGPSQTQAASTNQPAPSPAPSPALSAGEVSTDAGLEHGPAVTPAKISTEPAPNAHASSGHDAKEGVSAEQSLRWLANGNKRYTKKRFRADGRSEGDRQRNLKTQKPHAIILSCADSRVPPEIVFDQGIGEVFTIRVAGEALDSSVIASIEYAVEHLGPRLLVVMGHTQCGAVDTVLKVPEGQSAGSEALDRLLADIRPRLKTVSSQTPSPQLEVESALNADGVARDLLQRSDIIRRKVEAGDLVVKPALYWLDSGEVKFY